MKVWIEYYKSGIAAFINSTKVEKSITMGSFQIGKDFSFLSSLDQKDLKRFLDTEGTLVDETRESYLYEIDL